MLEKLEVLNGKMSLEFDTLNSKYTVFINEDVNELILNYELRDDAAIIIENNYNLNDGSVVTLLVSDGKKTTSYLINVYKNKTEKVDNSISNLIDLEINTKKEVSDYAGPGIASVCFVLILFLFVLLFHKRKSK